jgi:hypothetical protein
MRNFDSTLDPGTHKRFVSARFWIRKVAHRRPLLVQKAVIYRLSVATSMDTNGDGIGRQVQQRFTGQRHQLRSIYRTASISVCA